MILHKTLPTLSFALLNDKLILHPLCYENLANKRTLILFFSKLQKKIHCYVQYANLPNQIMINFE